MEQVYRTHYVSECTKELTGKMIVLNGWVQKRRDLGGLIFIDLRDRTGLVQIVFNPEISPEAAVVADQVRSEYVLAVRGEVVERDPENVNPNMETGEIEVHRKRGARV